MMSLQHQLLPDVFLTKFPFESPTQCGKRAKLQSVYTGLSGRRSTLDRGALKSDYSQVKSCICHCLLLLVEAALVLEAWESNLVAG